MKMSVIKEMSSVELNERLIEERKQLNKLKINHAVTPIENTKKIGEYKQTVARILTELRKREIDNI